MVAARPTTSSEKPSTPLKSSSKFPPRSKKDHPTHPSKPETPSALPPPSATSPRRTPASTKFTARTTRDSTTPSPPLPSHKFRYPHYVLYTLSFLLLFRHFVSFHSHNYIVRKSFRV